MSINKTEILNNYFEDPTNEEYRKKLKNMLIAQIIYSDTASGVNGAKFLLENIFDWKNDGAIKSSSSEDKINVTFVSNMQKDKDNGSK